MSAIVCYPCLSALLGRLLINGAYHLGSGTCCRRSSALAGIQLGRDLLLRHPAQESSLPNDSASLAEVHAGDARLPGPLPADRHSFQGKFSKSDPELLLKRLAAHEPDQAFAA